MAAADDVDSPEHGAPQRRLTVIMHADIAGSSRLMEADETGRYARLIACRQLIDAELAEHGGRLIGSAGDAVLATFASVTERLAAAIALQRAMAEQNTGLPADRQLLLRIGLDLGDVIIDCADIFGTGVNVAARLEALAEPGGIVVAAAVRDQTAGKVDVAFEDRGLSRVKNIAEPIRVFAVVEAAAGTVSRNRAQQKRPGSRRAWRWVLAAIAIVAALGVAVVLLPGWRATTDDVSSARSDDAPPAGPVSVGKPVIAVLPFGDRGSAGDRDYFSEV